MDAKCSNDDTHLWWHSSFLHFVTHKSHKFISVRADPYYGFLPKSSRLRYGPLDAKEDGTSASNRRAFPRIPADLEHIGLFVREGNLALLEETHFLAVLPQSVRLRRKTSKSVNGARWGRDVRYGNGTELAVVVTHLTLSTLGSMKTALVRASANRQ
jgi:hypothetical protein